MKTILSVLLAAVIATVCGTARTALAADGVIQINQARALAGGVSTGDAAGFPISITESGSYRLVGALVVTTPDTPAISVTASADHVTLDLNGFSIQGPADCSRAGCSPGGSGSGIEAHAGRSIAIRNGAVEGFRECGVGAGGGEAVVHIEQVRAVGNGAGICAGGPSVSLSFNSAYDNGGPGFAVHSDRGCTLTSNVATNNMSAGFDLSCSGVIAGNAAFGNGNSGIESDGAASVVVHNSVRMNGNRGIDVSGHSVVAGNAVHESFTLGIQSHAAVIEGNAVGLSGSDGGIVDGGGSVVAGNSVLGSQGKGIDGDQSSAIVHNAISYADAEGIEASGLNLIVGNTIHQSVGAGIRTLGTSAHGGNVIGGIIAGVEIDGGAALSSSLCEGMSCP